MDRNCQEEEEEEGYGFSSELRLVVQLEVEKRREVVVDVVCGMDVMNCGSRLFGEG